MSLNRKTPDIPEFSCQPPSFMLRELVLNDVSKVRRHFHLCNYIA
jgi:hypothetical protein